MSRWGGLPMVGLVATRYSGLDLTVTTLERLDISIKIKRFLYYRPNCGIVVGWRRKPTNCLILHG